ncbi:hypothetical protein AeNC1_014330, partial [Aphanomyces euteiches]
MGLHQASQVFFTMQQGSQLDGIAVFVLSLIVGPPQQATCTVVVKREGNLEPTFVFATSWISLIMRLVVPFIVVATLALARSFPQDTPVTRVLDADRSLLNAVAKPLPQAPPQYASAPLPRKPGDPNAVRPMPNGNPRSRGYGEVQAAPKNPGLTPNSGARHGHPAGSTKLTTSAATGGPPSFKAERNEKGVRRPGDIIGGDKRSGASPSAVGKPSGITNPHVKGGGAKPTGAKEPPAKRAGIPPAGARGPAAPKPNGPTTPRENAVPKPNGPLTPREKAGTKPIAPAKLGGKQDGSKPSGAKKPDVKKAGTKLTSPKTHGTKNAGTKPTKPKKRGAKKAGIKLIGAKKLKKAKTITHGTKKNTNPKKHGAKKHPKKHGTKKTGAKHASAKKHGAKKPTNPKKHGAKKTGAKPTTPKKPEAKKTGATPTTPKKHGAKKAGPEKPNNPKKPEAKKTGAKPTTPKKPEAKKTGAKPTTPKKHGAKKAGPEKPNNPKKPVAKKVGIKLR